MFIATTGAFEMKQRQHAYLLSYCMFAYHMPTLPYPFSKIGHWMRRALCKKMFRDTKKFIIGAKVCFGTGVNMEIGNHSNIGKGSWIANDTVIGDDVMMGPDIIIFAYNHRNDRLDIPITQQGCEERRPVKLCDDVWIGVRSIIIPGVTVGSHSIICAGAVVTKDASEYCVVAGNPAKVVKDRRDK